MHIRTLIAEENSMNRRHFAASASLLATAPLAAQAGPNQLESTQVRNFVGKSHRDFDAVVRMLKDEPLLVNSAWDWGNGDWETGLGAASHMGRRDIAELLIDSGARIDLFAAAMLGQLSIIRAIGQVYPDFHATPGPHGIPLITHTIYGKAPARATFEYVLAASADVNEASNQGGTPLMAAAGTNQVELVRILLDKGANPNAKDQRSQTALDVARQRGAAAAVAILEKI